MTLAGRRRSGQPTESDKDRDSGEAARAGARGPARTRERWRVPARRERWRAPTRRERWRPREEAPCGWAAAARRRGGGRHAAEQRGHGPPPPGGGRRTGPGGVHRAGDAEEGQWRPVGSSWHLGRPPHPGRQRPVAGAAASKRRGGVAGAGASRHTRPAAVPKSPAGVLPGAGAGRPAGARLAGQRHKRVDMAMGCWEGAPPAGRPEPARAPRSCAARGEAPAAPVVHPLHPRRRRKSGHGGQAPAPGLPRPRPGAHSIPGGSPGSSRSSRPGATTTAKDSR